MKRAPGCVRGAAVAGAGLPRSRANPLLPGKTLISSKKGRINMSTISNASRFIHRFCPGNRPAGRAGTRSARGGGGERGRPVPGMAAALGLQMEHTSRLSAPAPPSPCGAAAKSPSGPAAAAWPRPCLAPRRGRGGAAEPPHPPPAAPGELRHLRPLAGNRARNN